MGVDLWIPADLARILASKQQAAIEAFDPDNPYLHGYLAALRHLTVEFGIQRPVARPPELESVIDVTPR